MASTVAVAKLSVNSPVLQVERDRPDAMAAVGEQIDDELVLKHLDAAACLHGLRQGAGDLGAGGVAAGMGDAWHRMGAFGAQHQVAAGAVELGTDLGELAHAGRPLVDQNADRLLLAEAGSGADRILEVQLGRILIAERRGDAALGQEGGRVAQHALADQRDLPFARRAHGRRQAGDAAADDDDVVEALGRFGIGGCQQIGPASWRWRVGISVHGEIISPFRY